MPGHDTSQLVNASGRNMLGLFRSDDGAVVIDDRERSHLPHYYCEVAVPDPAPRRCSHFIRAQHPMAQAAPMHQPARTSVG